MRVAHAIAGGGLFCWKRERNKIMNKGLKISIIVGILVTAFSIAYYFVIYLPHQAQEQLDLKNQAAQQNARDLQDCLNQADADGLTLWNYECKSGYATEQTTLPGRNCKLPIVVNTVEGLFTRSYTDKIEEIPVVNNSIRDAKNICFQKYPQN